MALPPTRPRRCSPPVRCLLMLVALATPAWGAQAAAPPVAPAAAPPEIVITDALDLPLQVERMALLRDPTGSLDLAQVRAPTHAQDFETAAPGIPNLGITRDAVWARFAVRNATAEAMPLLLVLAEPRMAQVGFFALDQLREKPRR